MTCHSLTGQTHKLLLSESNHSKSTSSTVDINKKHKCPEKGRFFISSVAHSSPSASDRRSVHKSLILLGLTKIPFQNKQPPKASDHPEASPTVNVCSLSSVHRQLLPPGPPGASVWAPRVSSQKNGPSFDLEPSYVGGLFLFFLFFNLFTLWQQALPDWAVTTCHLGMWHPLRPPHEIPNHLRCSRRGSRWETNRTQEDSRNSVVSDSTSLWGIHTNMMSYIYTARTITDSVRICD